MDDSALSRGPVGKAAKMGQVQCVNNTKQDPDFSPWSNAAEERGYEAIAAVPLSINGRILGVYAIYSEVAGAFDEKMLALLETLGRDVGVAMLHLQERKEREQG